MSGNGRKMHFNQLLGCMQHPKGGQITQQNVQNNFLTLSANNIQNLIKQFDVMASNLEQIRNQIVFCFFNAFCSCLYLLISVQNFVVGGSTSTQQQYEWVKLECRESNHCFASKVNEQSFCFLFHTTYISHVLRVFYTQLYG